MESHIVGGKYDKVAFDENSTFSKWTHNEKKDYKI